MADRLTSARVTDWIGRVDAFIAEGVASRPAKPRIRIKAGSSRDFAPKKTVRAYNGSNYPAVVTGTPTLNTMGSTGAHYPLPINGDRYLRAHCYDRAAAEQMAEDYAARGYNVTVDPAHHQSGYMVNMIARTSNCRR